MTVITEYKNPLVVEPTELQDLYVCPRLWSFAHKERLRPKRPSEELFLGSGIHEGLQAYYEGGDPLQVFVDWAKQEREAIRSRVVLRAEEEGKLAEAEALGLSLLEAYTTWAPEQDQRDFEEILYLEQSAYIPLNDLLSKNTIALVEELGYDGVTLALRYDMVVRDRWKRVWILDHKTCSQFPSETVLRLDAQMGFYIWAANQIWPDLKIGGGMFNHIRKSNPKRARTPIFKRTSIYRGGREIDSLQRNLISSIEILVQQRASDFHLPFPGRHCGWRCKYSSLCSAIEEQSNGLDELKTSLFVVSDRINWLDEGE